MLGKARLSLEALEVRDCPATAILANGVLSVIGTQGSDNIHVMRSGNYVGVNNQWFAASSINRVVISALNGNDTIRDDSNFSATIYGGLGNDTIYGGRGHDTIYGGSGNDNIVGGRGNDVIFGGGGNDTLTGGLGNNNVVQGSPTAGKANSAIESQIISLVNQYRASYGLPPLKVNFQLNVAADMHSADMAALGKMEHDLYGTTRPKVSDRLDAVGYDNWSNSISWGENIAYGQRSASEVMTAWMNSAGHRANILNTGYTEIGVSVRADANGTLWFTQAFGHVS